MDASIIVALITSFGSIAAVVITAAASNMKIEHQLELSQAVMNTKIESLTTEVRHHNEFARRMPVVEEQIRSHDRRLEVLEHEGKAG